MRPSKEIQAALEGGIAPDDLTQAARSSLDFSIYRIACRILNTPGNDPKRQMIESHPVTLQPLIKAECRRVFNLRRGVK